MSKLTDLQKELTALIAMVINLCPILTARFLRMKGLKDITVYFDDGFGCEIFRVIESQQVNGIKDRLDMLYYLQATLYTKKDQIHRIVLTFDKSRGNMMDTYYVD